MDRVIKVPAYNPDYPPQSQVKPKPAASGKTEEEIKEEEELQLALAISQSEAEAEQHKKKNTTKLFNPETFTGGSSNEDNLKVRSISYA